jgi:fatty-acyl-CoA synthase
MKLSYAHGTCDEPLMGETIGANFRRTVARIPDADALVSRHQGVRHTYAQLAEEVDRVARGLVGFGLGKGDRLGIWSPTCAEWTLVQYATAQIGVILVNINPAYRTSELEYALRHSGCRALISAQSFKTSDYVSMVDEVRGGLPALERAIFLGTPGWDELLDAGAGISEDELDTRASKLEFDDPINIQYTSGTTGSPKGATLTHHNILNHAYFAAERLGLGDGDRVCIPVPLYHCFGMVLGNLGSTTHGACMVYPEAAFEPGAVLETVQEERCTVLYGVPTMFIAELGHADFDSYDLGSLRTGVMAGSPCPIEVMRRVVSDMHMPEVTIAFGMTETSPVATQTDRSDELERRVSTVGRVQPHTEIKIVDPASGRTVPRGHSGEFCARGYLVMRGYWEDPERTGEAIDGGGWMHTGDLAEMDEEGFVKIVGRIKDMIIRGGENVYPREVEEFLYGHAAVSDVQVIGVPDERYGEELMAWVVLRDGEHADEDELREFCRSQIAHYKVPRYFKFVDEFPMTVTGKVQKFKMREVAVEELGLAQVEALETA